MRICVNISILGHYYHVMDIVLYKCTKEALVKKKKILITKQIIR